MNTQLSRRRLIASAALLAAGTARAQATRFPERPITLIVPFAPGGIADITARTGAQAMSGTLGQTVVVDHRPSAGSIVGSSARRLVGSSTVAQAAPDGHTLLLMSNANAVSASLFKKLPFDVQKDFAPVGTLAVFDLALFVDAGSRYKTVAELLADAKARPGKLSIGTISAGSTQHLAAELFKSRTGIDAVVVPYKGTPAVLTALRAREIDLAFEIVAPLLAQVSAKALRALAVTSDAHHPGPARRADAGRSGCGELQRRVLECARRPGPHAARNRRADQPGCARGTRLGGRQTAPGRTRRARPAGQPGPAGQPAGERDRALARGDRRGKDRTGVAEGAGVRRRSFRTQRRKGREERKGRQEGFGFDFFFATFAPFAS